MAEKEQQGKKAKHTASPFVDHSSGVVRDVLTGLMWQRYSLGVFGATPSADMALRYSWQEAMLAAKTANHSGGMYGYVDWRLPTLAELKSLVRIGKQPPFIDQQAFPATASHIYWSSSEYRNIDDHAWGVNFNSGYDNAGNKGHANFVRLVRGGLR